ncbi:MAG: hypothetical protein QOG63_3108 [Thermoleophilaceae bacterium]|jgi:hypothetical protein|nr:hypothetical protein [Thermoleophilaceae bacterium]
MRRRMSPRPKLVLLAFLLACLPTLTGCVNTREHNAAREGLPEKIGHLEYNVYITRELNLADVEDQGYYKGPEAPPGYALYGVWLTVCNPSDTVASPHWMASSRFTIQDTQGNNYHPIPLPKDNVFAYQPVPLKHNACFPAPGSLAAASPTNGSLLIFKLPLDALENRPLDLIIESPPLKDGRDSGRIELDV